ncbi:MAG: hypothetical protein ISS72_07475 [Candidatus Brocadiae bacterium]|nr:hypothetical protein [Candidatus Brocadiia bacterium]
MAGLKGELTDILGERMRAHEAKVLNNALAYRGRQLLREACEKLIQTTQDSQPLKDPIAEA